MRTFEMKMECERLVERLIWDAVDTSYGDFNGIKERSRADLYALRAAIDEALAGAT